MNISSRSRFVAALGFGFTLWLLPLLASAEEPFFTEEAETLRPGVGSIDLGVALRNEPRDFGVESRDRQWDLGTTRFSFGLGKLVELQLSGIITSSIVQDDETSTNSGDWTFGTKIWMFKEKKHRPALAFLYEVKLPNGSDEDGGVTDETDFFGYLLASKQVGAKNILHGNLGLGILGNPFANSEQNDIFIVRLGWERKISDKRLFGIEGVMQRGPQENDDPRFVHAVYAQKVGDWAVYGGVAIGIGDDADDMIADIGVRRRFRLWSPGEPERRNDW